MLGQAHFALEGSAADGAVRSAAEAEGVKVGFCDRLGGGGAAFAVELRAGVAERLKDDFGAHTLHAELALFSGGGFAFFLAIDIGDVGVEEVFAAQGVFEIVANEKAGAIGVCQDDKAAFARGSAQEGKLFGIGHDAKAARLEDRGVDDLTEGIDVVAALYDHSLFEFNHGAPPVQAPRSEAPEAAPGRQSSFSCARRFAGTAPPHGGRSFRRRGAPPSW